MTIVSEATIWSVTYNRNWWHWLRLELARIINYDHNSSLIVLATVIAIVNYDRKTFIVQATEGRSFLFQTSSSINRNVIRRRPPSDWAGCWASTSSPAEDYGPGAGRGVSETSTASWRWQCHKTFFLILYLNLGTDKLERLSVASFQANLRGTFHVVHSRVGS